MFRTSLVAALAVTLLGCNAAPAAPGNARGHSAPADGSVWTVNVAKVNPGMLALARRYFEDGWLPARREALARGHIKSFRIVAAEQESPTQPEFVLITEYADQASFDAREARFDEIFAALGRDGPIFVDGKGRDDIFASLAGLEDYRDVGGDPSP